MDDEADENELILLELKIDMMSIRLKKKKKRVLAEVKELIGMTA